MARYTKKNLREVEDMAPKFGLAPDLEARFARQDLEAEQTGLSYQRLAPNAKGAFGHSHDQDEEIYLVVSGSGRMMLDDEVVEITSWTPSTGLAGDRARFSAGPTASSCWRSALTPTTTPRRSRSTGRASLAADRRSLAVLLGGGQRAWPARSLTWLVSTNSFATPLPPMRATASSSASAQTCWTITAAIACQARAARRAPVRPRRWPLLARDGRRLPLSLVEPESKELPDDAA